MRGTRLAVENHIGVLPKLLFSLPRQCRGSSASRLEPILRDASLRDAPQDEALLHLCSIQFFIACRHCGSIPALFTTAVTLSISRFSAFSKAAALPPVGSMPAAVSCFLASGVLMAAIASAVILSTIGCGRLGRPYRPTMVARS